jgi:hypothetical protein
MMNRKGVSEMSNIKDNITVQEILIQDENSGESYRVKTIRTAKEVAEFINESETEIVMEKIEVAVFEEYMK